MPDETPSDNPEQLREVTGTPSRKRRRYTHHTRGFSALPRINENAIPAYLMTRKELLERADISESEFRGLVRLNRIQAVRRTNGGWGLYNESCLEKIRKIKDRRVKRLPMGGVGGDGIVRSVYTVEEGLTLLVLVREGLSVDEIFFRSKIHPGIIYSFLREHDAMLGTLTIGKDVLDQINALQIEGVSFPLRSPRDILDAFLELAVEPRCRTCKKKAPSSTCVPCTRRALLDELSATEATRAAAAKPAKPGG